jgi:hypothetical protein
MLNVSTRRLTTISALVLLMIAVPAAGVSVGHDERPGRFNTALKKFPDRALLAAFLDEKGDPAPSIECPHCTVQLSFFEDVDYIKLSRKGHEYSSKEVFESKKRATDSSRDVFADAFISTAHASGHTVKIYKGTVNKAIQDIFPGRRTNRPGYIYYSNLDNALLAFDKRGRLVSAMSRETELARDAMKSIAKGTLDMFSEDRISIWAAGAAIVLEQKLPRLLLEENLLMELPPPKPQ